MTIPEKYTRRVLIASTSLARKAQRLDDACGAALTCAVSAPEHEVPPLWCTRKSEACRESIGMGHILHLWNHMFVGMIVANVHSRTC